MIHRPVVVGIALAASVWAVLSLGEHRLRTWRSARTCFADTAPCDGVEMTVSYVTLLDDPRPAARYGGWTLNLARWPGTDPYEPGQQVSMVGTWQGVDALVVASVEHHPMRRWKEAVGALTLLLWAASWACRIRRGGLWPTC